jgi:hypothetical protein
LNNEYYDFKRRKIKTVGELIGALEKYSSDTGLLVGDADCGGYDIVDKNYVVLIEQENRIRIGHLEQELAKAEDDGRISRQEYDELNEEC